MAELREFARLAGANEIGFAAVPQEWVFQDTAIRYTQAIVLIMEMNKARMDLAPNPDTAVMVHETYNQLGQVSNKVAGWLRGQGYAAHAGHPPGWDGALPSNGSGCRYGVAGSKWSDYYARIWPSCPPSGGVHRDRELANL